MKKFTAWALLLLLLIQSMNMLVFAAVAASGTITVDHVAVAYLGDDQIIEVPIRMQNNPGVAALKIAVSYDTNKLTLVSVANGSVMQDAMFETSEFTTIAPYHMMWSSAATENFTANGILATLKFKVAEGLNFDEAAAISVSVDNDNTYRVNATGSEESVTLPVSAGSLTIVTPNQPTTKLLSFTVANVNKVYTGEQMQIQVPITVANNPGLVSTNVSVAYDQTKLTLVGAENGDVLGGATFTTSESTSSHPYYLTWNSVGNQNYTGDGLLATLTFVPTDALAFNEKTDITITVDQTNTYSVDEASKELIPVDKIQRVFGSVTLDDPQITFSVADTAVTQSADGDTYIDLPVTITGNTGIYAGAFKVAYDDSKLELDEILANGLFSSATRLAGEIRFNNGSAGNVAQDGTVLTLRFLVLDGFVVGETTNVSLAASTSASGLVYGQFGTTQRVYESVALSAAAKVTLEKIPYRLGDINEDDAVDNRDVTALLRYLANWELDFVVNNEKADLNADNAIDGRDVTYFLRYFAKWEGYTLDR